MCCYTLWRIIKKGKWARTRRKVSLKIEEDLHPSYLGLEKVERGACRRVQQDREAS